MPARGGWRRLAAWTTMAVVTLLVACRDDPATTTPGAPVAGAEPPAAAVCGKSFIGDYTVRAYVDAASSAVAPACGDSMQNACPTIAAGIARCTTTPCAVLVRHGLYTESIAMKNGVNVFGSCRFAADTSGDPSGIPVAMYRTVVDAAPAAGTPGVTAAGLTDTTRLEGVVVVVRDATEPSTASIALAVSSSPQFVLRDTTLSAGAGAPGAAGQTEPDGSGEGGADGNGGRAPGGRACAARPVAISGGTGGEPQRLSNDTRCGFGFCGCGGHQNDDVSGGAQGSNSGSASGGGSGGVPLPSGQCIAAATGHDFEYRSGSSGNAGQCATSGGEASSDVFGTFQGTTWVAGSGGDGPAGAVGSGGGGGASGGACAFTDGTGFRFGQIPGSAGGGGGGGGCGGLGHGGRQGGASIPLLLAATSPGSAWTGNVLVPGPGGDGGRGADGGSGGPGAQGGRGQPNGGISVPVFGGAFSCGGAGGSGGGGGPGGAGSGGAGGNGGPSFGVALLDNAQYGTTTGIYPGVPGRAGGAGAAGANGRCGAVPGNDGVPGGGGTDPFRRYSAAEPPARPGSIG